MWGCLPCLNRSASTGVMHILIHKNIITNQEIGTAGIRELNRVAPC
nr:MAG TPA: hypothetical protein [Caudoviricetes sp.]